MANVAVLETTRSNAACSVGKMGETNIENILKQGSLYYRRQERMPLLYADGKPHRADFLIGNGPRKYPVEVQCDHKEKEYRYMVTQDVLFYRRVIEARADKYAKAIMVLSGHGWDNLLPYYCGGGFEAEVPHKDKVMIVTMAQFQSMILNGEIV